MSPDPLADELTHLTSVGRVDSVRFFRSWRGRELSLKVGQEGIDVQWLRFRRTPRLRADRATDEVRNRYTAFAQLLDQPAVLVVESHVEQPHKLDCKDSLSLRQAELPRAD